MDSLLLSGLKIFFVLSGVYPMSQFTVLPIGADVFWFAFDALLIAAIYLLIPVFKDKNVDKSMLFLKLFLLWVLIAFVRGVIAADNYWEWKNLIRFSFTMLLPGIAFLATTPDFVSKIYSFWLKYGIWLIFLFIPFMRVGDMYGAYLAPLMLLILVFPLLSHQWKIVVFLMTVMVFLGGTDSRSNLIRFTMAAVLGGLYYLPFLRKTILLKAMHITFFILPLVLLTLALTNTFNIFKIKEYIHTNTVVKKEGGKKEDLAADTRTFLYVENITSALRHDYVLQGRTPAKGYDSNAFGKAAKYKMGIGKMIRFSSEVSLLNIFTWYGLVGIVLYSLVFLVGTFLALYRSNNYFIKIIGVFVAFRWAYSFVEEFNRADIVMLSLWIMIGMCYSSYFRRMDIHELKMSVAKMVPKINY